ncbi:MAG: ferrous iron transport protein A [Acidobacteria bacterium]|nr:ferrous iron transport protein A [Acidobacteriota bacterium]
MARHVSGVFPLCDLRGGEEAEIVRIGTSCEGLSRMRLLELGVTPGTRVRRELSNLFGDPAAYRIRSTLIALRREQTSDIWVQIPTS